MKKVTIYMFITLYLLLFLFYSCLSEKKAELILSTQCYDFGNIMTDSIYEGSVIITNSGKAPLVIESVHPGCGCTTSNISKDTILSKDSCLLSFQYNTHSKMGYQENYITIIANTDSLVHMLQVKANVQ